MSLALWRVTTRLATPFVRPYLVRRVRQGKEISSRLPERYGISTHPRPDGAIIWVHAASMGETMSVLPIIDALSKQASILLTTGTTTSAELAATRARAIHQFAPLDTPDFYARFLDHWQPAAAVFVESEIWPNCLAALDRRRIPRVLVNARLSARSAARWARLPGAARSLFGGFSWIAAQSEADANAFRHLGLEQIETKGNLKFSTPVLPDDPEARAAIEAACPAPRLLAASTHEGEDVAIIEAHRTLLAHYAELVTIIAPRHPERAPAIAAMAQEFDPTRRSRGEVPSPGKIHIADTLGELGLFYRLCPIAFIGGSLVPAGGHNMIEAAQLGCAVITGPYVDNFRDVAALLQQEGALAEIAGAGALAPKVAELLHNEKRRLSMATAGRRAVCRFADLPDILAARILELIR